MGQKPPRPLKTPDYLPHTTIQTLIPPANLSTQDIMDLPIIFADDNKILEPNISAQEANTSGNHATNTQISLAAPKVLQTITPGKFMLLNKQAVSPSNFIIPPTTIKKQNPANGHKPPPKYTKIILSSKKHNLEEIKTSHKIENLSPEITLKKVISSQVLQEKSIKETYPIVELIDLENEIKATAVPKPNVTVDKATAMTKALNKDVLLSKSDGSLILKRPNLDIVDDGDPDYIPPKNLKLL